MKIKPKLVTGVAGTSDLYYLITASISVSVQCRSKYPKRLELSAISSKKKLSITVGKSYTVFSPKETGALSFPDFQEIVQIPLVS